MVRWVVEPNAVGGWDVRRDAEANQVFRVSSRAEAEREARRRADASGSEVVVLDGRGGVLDTYVPAPRPTERHGRAAGPAPAGVPPRAATPPLVTPVAAAAKAPAEPVDDPVERFAGAVANGDGDLRQRLAAAGQAELEARADAALGSGFKAWYARADEGQRLAAKVLIAAALLGPIGASFLTVVQALANPTVSTQILQSLFWLVVLTLPILAAPLVGVLVLGHANGPVSLVVAGAAAVAGAYVVGLFHVPQQLGKLYCYASATSDGVVYEHACRVMDTQGFVTDSLNVLSPTTSLAVIGNAFNMVADARGGLMAVCGVAAGLSGGYLIRRALQT